jgi:hypothetical protein
MAISDMPDEAQAEERFKQKLVELGLVQEIKVSTGVPGGDRTPINVKGKPLSQSIIEDRRWVAVYYFDYPQVNHIFREVSL